MLDQNDVNLGLKFVPNLMGPRADRLSTESKLSELMLKVSVLRENYVSLVLRVCVLASTV